MSLQIIGAGLGRTGTMSLKLALEQLGFRGCYHMIEVLLEPEPRMGQWLEAARGRPDWPAIFSGYAATVDYPGCRFWRELADYYPDAKVILTERDPVKWFESTQATIFSQMSRARFGDAAFREFFETLVFSQFGEHIHDRDYMVDAFERHNAEVKRAIAPDRLLVLEVAQGWEPLCEFLGVPVPDVPFPRTNSREEMQAMFAAARRARARQGAEPGADARDGAQAPRSPQAALARRLPSRKSFAAAWRPRAPSLAALRRSAESRYGEPVCVATTVISAIGATFASSMWPAFVLPSANATTACTCTYGLPSRIEISPTIETSSLF